MLSMFTKTRGSAQRGVSRPLPHEFDITAGLLHGGGLQRIRPELAQEVTDQLGALLEERRPSHHLHPEELREDALALERESCAAQDLVKDALMFSSSTDSDASMSSISVPSGRWRR
jgi:hypothetical protein